MRIWKKKIRLSPAPPAWNPGSVPGSPCFWSGGFLWWHGHGGQDPYDDQDPFDESPRFAAIDGHSQFQVLDSQEDGLTKKMG